MLGLKLVILMKGVAPAHASRFPLSLSNCAVIIETELFKCEHNFLRQSAHELNLHPSRADTFPITCSFQFFSSSLKQPPDENNQLLAAYFVQFEMESNLTRDLMINREM